jgi:prophage regulatory protein
MGHNVTQQPPRGYPAFRWNLSRYFLITEIAGMLQSAAFFHPADRNPLMEQCFGAADIETNAATPDREVSTEISSILPWRRLLLARHADNARLGNWKSRPSLNRCLAQQPTRTRSMDSDTRSAASPARILRLPAVISMTGLKRSMIYQLQAERRFPRSVKITDFAVGWLDTEVQAWVAQRAAERTNR